MASFLLSPEVGLPEGSLAPDLLERLREAHRLLLAGDSAGAVRRVEAMVAAGGPAADAANVLLAGVELARGAPAAAIARLEPVAARTPGYAAARLPLARAHELEGRVVVAFERYAELEAAATAARERSRLLLPAASAEVRRRLEDALARLVVAEADPLVAWLERWAPAERATIDARRRVAVLRGDEREELAALRRLVPFEPESRELLWRQGELELEVGDAGRGLALFEGMARKYPADAEVARGLARARFLWRLSTLPPRVQAAVRRESPTRADFAALLYWLVPGVRAGRPGATRVATDVLDHPWREEIVRVANFGLLRVDETLHQFEPNRALSRGDAHLAFARLLFLFGRGAPCLRSFGVESGPLSREGACALLAACGVVDGRETCVGGGAAAGETVLEELRRTLDLLDGSAR
ncbi:MAG: hypothetical protein M5U13_06830 [Thermoanaerobaculia bacterium]|nr:hypothetical protein [Thermoanaerobaculia bacterium]